MARDRLDGRDDLDRAAAGPDDGDALARQVDVVAPARRVERQALEAVEAGDRRDGRDVELAAGGDQDVGLVLAALVVSTHRPLSSSQSARWTSVPVRMRSSTPCRRATSST